MKPSEVRHSDIRQQLTWSKHSLTDAGNGDFVLKIGAVAVWSMIRVV